MERDARWHYDQMLARINANAWPPDPEAFAGWLHERRAEGYRAGYAAGLTRAAVPSEGEDGR